MNVYGAFVEWYWQVKIEVLGENPVTVFSEPQISRLDQTRDWEPKLVYIVH
jgi:hypothetical protein